MTDKTLSRVRALPRPVEQLCVGNRHGCARIGDGSVYCWERGEPAKRWSDVQQAKDIACNYAACAVTGDGRVMCGGPEESHPIAGIRDAQQVGVGIEHGCALRTDGTVWCWGSNDLGAVGLALPPYQPRAVSIPVGPLR